MRKTVNKRLVLILNIICPIAIGAMIYYLISPEVIFVKRIDSMIGNAINLHISKTDSIIVRFVRNYLLDMMWGYALVFALFYIIGNNTASISKIFFIAFLFSVDMEILQITSIAQGTFDVFDIGVEFLSEAIAVFIIRKLYKREEIQNEKEN